MKENTRLQSQTKKRPTPLARSGKVFIHNFGAHRLRPASKTFAVSLLLLLAFISPACVVQQTGAEQPPASTASATTPAAPQPAPEFDAASWLAEQNTELETHGVLIETLAPGRVIASHNADKLFNPASIVKLATSLVALKRLGPDYRFEIQVYADGAVDERGTFEGQLYVMQSAPTFGDVGANMMAEELRRLGIKRINGVVNVSPDFCFNFSERPEESAERLVKALKLEGPQPKTAVVGSPNGSLLFVFYSHPLREILLYMNAHSSNFTAERVGNLFGGPQAVQQFLVQELKLPPEQVRVVTTSGREQNRLSARGVLAVLRALIEETRRRGLEPSDIMPVADEDSGTLRRRFSGTPLEGAVLGKTGTQTPDVDGGIVSLAGIIYTENAGELAFVLLDQGERLAENRDLEDKLLEEAVRERARPRPATAQVPRDLLHTSSMRVEVRGTLQRKGRRAA